jgi:hypothetical protein
MTSLSPGPLFQSGPIVGSTEARTPGVNSATVFSFERSWCRGGGALYAGTPGIDGTSRFCTAASTPSIWE